MLVGCQKFAVLANRGDSSVLHQRDAVGHAVRAMYLYSGMADIAIADGDFPISALFEPYLEKYRGTTLFSVDA